MKKLICVTLALILLISLCSGCAEEETLTVTSNQSRLLALATGEGKRYREMAVPARLTEEPIAGFIGMELGVDAELILPDVQAIPLASVRKRDITQAEADTLLDILCNDKPLLSEDTGESANLLLENGAIQGILKPIYYHSGARYWHVDIRNDSALFFREPCDGYHALNFYDDERLNEMHAYDYSNQKAASIAESFANRSGLLENMQCTEHKAMMRTLVDHEGKATKAKPVMLYEYDPMVCGVPVIASMDLEYYGPQYLNSQEGRNTVVVLNHQVQFVHLAAPFTDQKIIESDCAMLPFEDVCAIFRSAIPDVSEKWEEIYSQIILQSAVLSRIRLCERFIPEKEGSAEGMFVPVWDFQVTFTATLPQPWTRTVMTINAIDGSILFS